MLSWFYLNWGDLASGIGLLVSLVVLFVSRGARRAALQARAAVDRRSLSDELRQCSDDISFINILNENQRWELSAHVAYRTVQRISFVLSRWAALLDEASRKNLSLAVSLLDTVTSQLRKFQNQHPKTADADRLAASVLRVTSLLSAEMGKHELAVYTQGEKQ
jgi:hypothetical protein